MADHRVPEAVCFDAYGTLLELLDPVDALRRALLVAGYEYDHDVVVAAFAAEVAFYRHNQDQGGDTTGLHALRTLCAAVFSDALPDGPPVGVALEILVDALQYRLYDDVVPTLDALTAAGVRCGVISNWDCSLSGVLVGLGIADRFDVVSASAVVGARKPDPRIFEVSLTALRCSPKRVVHVGDDPALDVVGAIGAGMRAIELTRDPAGGAPGSTDRITSLVELPRLLLG